MYKYVSNRVLTLKYKIKTDQDFYFEKTTKNLLKLMKKKEKKKDFVLSQNQNMTKKKAINKAKAIEQFEK